MVWDLGLATAAAESTREVGRERLAGGLTLHVAPADALRLRKRRRVQRRAVCLLPDG